MKLNFSKKLQEVFITTKLVAKKLDDPEEVTRRVRFSFWHENEQLHNDLDRQYGGFASDQCYQGLMRYHSCNGDAFHFQESSALGRLTFAQESGLFCNLDR